MAIDDHKAKEISQEMISFLIGREFIYLDSMKVLFAMQCAISKDNGIEKEKVLGLLSLFLAILEEQDWSEL